jgi:thiol-disulfide isomerase/thioredoxin
MPILNEIEEEYASKGVKVIGINQRESPDKVRRFVRENDYEALILLDRDGSVGSDFSAMSLPTVVIADKQGTVRQTIRGLYPDMKDRIKAEIEPLL